MARASSGRFASGKSCAQCGTIAACDAGLDRKRAGRTRAYLWNLPRACDYTRSRAIAASLYDDSTRAIALTGSFLTRFRSRERYPLPLENAMAPHAADFCALLVPPALKAACHQSVRLSRRQ